MAVDNVAWPRKKSDRLVDGIRQIFNQLIEQINQLFEAFKKAFIGAFEETAKKIVLMVRQNEETDEQDQGGQILEGINARLPLAILAPRRSTFSIQRQYSVQWIPQPLQIQSPKLKQKNQKSKYRPTDREQETLLGLAKLSQNCLVHELETIKRLLNSQRIIIKYLTDQKSQMGKNCQQLDKDKIDAKIDAAFRKFRFLRMKNDSLLKHLEKGKKERFHGKERS